MALKRVRDALADPGRRKLVASIVFNFLARFPGVLVFLVVLPRANAALDAHRYGLLMSYLALGLSLCLLFGGVGTVGRREIGRAISEGRRQDETEVVHSMLMAGLVLLAVAALALAALARVTGAGWLMIAIGVIPPIGSAFNVMADIRTAYNEHYLTVILQSVAQLVVLLFVLVTDMRMDNEIAVAMVLNAPAMVGCLLGGVLLVLGRPYLLKRGRHHRMLPFLREAGVLSLSDGSVTAPTNVGIYLLSLSGAVAASGWYATIYRLFQTFLAPAMLILFPLTSYMNLHWSTWSASLRRRLERWSLIAAVGYGLLVGLTMLTLGGVYVKASFHNLGGADGPALFIASLFFSGIVAQKTYGLLVYSVRPAHRMVYSTLLAMTASSLLGLGAAALIAPRPGMVIFMAVAGSLLFAVVFAEGLRRLGPGGAA